MLARLAKIDLEYKEKGAPEDQTRLCNSWRGALPEDKDEVLKMIFESMENGSKLTATKIKDDNPKYNIYTTACIQCAISNYRKKWKSAKEKKDESKFLFSG